MAYVITGTLTFSSQANRDAARSRIDTAISVYNYTNRSGTIFTAGIAHPTTTTLTISVESGNDDSTAASFAAAIYNAAVQSNRHSSGYLSVNKL
jgi:hypothetical protein